LDFSAQLLTPTDWDKVQIVTPETSIFSEPMFAIGETINISGIATSSIVLSLNDEQHMLSPVDGTWYYLWNTSGLPPGMYDLNVSCGGAQDRRLVRLFDLFPPEITIEEPSVGFITQATSLLISGQSNSAVGIQQIDVSVDNSSYRTTTGTNHWSIHWNISSLPIGDHLIYARAVDLSGLQTIQHICFVINETGHDWKPHINNLSHIPRNATNTSNIIISANVTSTSPFALKQIVLYWNDSITTHSSVMYRYGDNPVQSRHEEDPLKNESNQPVFGYELGQFPKNTTLTYWVIAYDTANNAMMSDKQSFTINS
jgi:hypothetical protein